MVILSEIYEPKVYNNLKTYEYAAGEVESLEEQLEKLLRIVKNHGFENEIGISLLHKHFEMMENECLVEEMKEYYSFISPQKSCGTDQLLAYLWKVDIINDKPTMFPLEFVQADAKASGIIKIRATLAKLKKHPEFLQELCEMVHNLDMVDTLGITISHRSHITEVDSYTIEYSDDSRRLLHVVPKCKLPVDEGIRAIYDELSYERGEINSVNTAFFVASNPQTNGGKLVDARHGCSIHICVHPCIHPVKSA